MSRFLFLCVALLVLIARARASAGPVSLSPGAESEKVAEAEKAEQSIVDRLLNIPFPLGKTASEAYKRLGDFMKSTGFTTAKTEEVGAALTKLGESEELAKQLGDLDEYNNFAPIGGGDGDGDGAPEIAGNAEELPEGEGGRTTSKRCEACLCNPIDWSPLEPELDEEAEEGVGFGRFCGTPHCPHASSAQHQPCDKVDSCCMELAACSAQAPPAGEEGDEAEALQCAACKCAAKFVSCLQGLASKASGVFTEGVGFDKCEAATANHALLVLERAQCKQFMRMKCFEEGVCATPDPAISSVEETCAALKIAKPVGGKEGAEAFSPE